MNMQLLWRVMTARSANYLKVRPSLVRGRHLRSAIQEASDLRVPNRTKERQEQ